MRKKILFIVDWPINSENTKALQELLDKDYSANYEWKVWSCKRKADNNLIYRWSCYTKGAFYAIKNRKTYHYIFIWQQMVGYILSEIKSIFSFKGSDIIFFTFLYNSNTLIRYFKKHLVGNAFHQSKAVIWTSLEMSNEVKKDFPKFDHKNYFTLLPSMDIIDINVPVAKELDDAQFRNGVYTAGKSERDFDIVIRAFRNTDIPVTIVCTDEEVINETDITSNIRILRFSQVSPEQYYALALQAFCVLVSVYNEKSPCGLLLITYAMANSIPIIATDCSGVRDFMVNNINGVLFKVGDSDAIRNGYEKLRKDDAFKSSLIQNANNTVMEMSAGKFMEKIIHIIEN